MAAATHAVATFPAISLTAGNEAPPVEVVLITQLGIGEGDRIIRDAGQRQAAHEDYIDALDEPSTRLGGMHLEHGDASSLYAFTVGAPGHPFHRHATPRTFTAISGSGGTQLRFANTGAIDLDRDPSALVSALRCVDIPPDCLFTVRFGSGTWHQFVSRCSGHSALFALSCHTNELGGALSADQRTLVEANAANIPALTEVLSEHVQSALAGVDFAGVPTIALTFKAPAASLAAGACTRIRDIVGRLRLRIARSAAPGFWSRFESLRPVQMQTQQPAYSLLHGAMGTRAGHDDCVEMRVPRDLVGAQSASAFLARVLEGFLENRPAGVERMMRVRNLLVMPLQLRTSPLGCPVSSLLSADRRCLFAGRFPVWTQAIERGDRLAQVLLGADDRHLRFRSCVSVEVLDNFDLRVCLGTRVVTRNLFGRCYMALIDRVHRRYISPTLLRMAVDYALAPDLRGHADAAAAAQT